MRFTSHSSATWPRRITLGFGAAALALQWGCYSYLPVQSSPPPVQARGAVVLNDQGRAALAERLGPLLEQVEGTFISLDSTAVVLEVTGTQDLRGGSSLWSGERVEIPATAVLGYRERKLSRGRSIALGIGVTTLLAVATFGLTLDLFGEDMDSGDTRDPRNPGDPVSTIGRIPVSIP